MKLRLRGHLWSVYLATLGMASLLYFKQGAERHELAMPSAAAEGVEQKSGDPPPLKVEKDAPLLLDEQPDASGKPAKPGKGPVANNSACYVCHANYEDEPLAQEHAAANVGCVNCHGESYPHRGDEMNVTPPDVLFPPEEIAPFCAKCHHTHNAPAEAVIARWQERCKVKTNPTEILCTDCHGEHRLKVRTIRWDKKTRNLIAGKISKPASKVIQVLIVTGLDFHDWRKTTPVLAEQLKRDLRIEVHVVEDPHFLDSPAIHRYDVLVLHFRVASLGKAGRANLKKFVKGGKGLVLVHFACAIWQDWREFKNLAGRVCDPNLRRHDPYGLFRVNIVNPDHPITRGLQSFEIEDELCTCLVGKRRVDMLATARSKLDGKEHLIAFSFGYGKGRVFHCVLGHDVKALANTAVGELFRRGAAWAAGHPPVAEKANPADRDKALAIPSAQSLK